MAGLPGGLAAQISATDEGSRRRGRCSSARASTTRSASTTGGSSTTASGSTLAQVKDAYRDLWHTGLETEEQQLGVDWQDIPQHDAFELGLQALELTFEQLVPKLGEPLAVQRRLEFTLAPGLTEWTIVCYLDLETRARAPSGEQLDRVVDYKVEGKPDRPAEGRPRPAGEPVPRRPVARGPTR